MSNIGWLAALISILFHGSFTVPMKGHAANSVNIDPFVFQTFKTIMCFSTCWFALPFLDSLKYSPLGILSGLLWVMGGTSGIFAVRNAGLAISVGIWSSIIVLVSYTWGVVIFNEKVNSKFITFISVLLLMIGLSGMSYSTSISVDGNKEDDIELTPEIDIDENNKREFLSDDDISMSKSSALERRLIPTAGSHDNDDENDDPNLDKYDLTSKNAKTISTRGTNYNVDTIDIFGVHFTRRKVGLVAALGNGLFSGSSYVPMQFLREDEKGLDYVISFAIGAASVTLTLWILRFFFSVYMMQSFSLGYKALPSFHLKVMWIPGCCSGLLWSIGNYGSILAVSDLGQAIGLSVSQGAMIVSGLWGIFWYREIADPQKTRVWFAAALLTCFSISILCHEHVD